MTSTQDFYKKLIKPIRDENLIRIINLATQETFSPYDAKLNYEERLDPIQELRSKFTTWSKDWVSGLEKFPYMYVMNGNTDSLNTIFNHYNNVSWKKGDYSYYSYWHKLSRKNHTELENPQDVEDLVVSWPGYTWGNKEQLDFSNKCTALRKHLDCAYLGLVKPDSIDISDFETASFSFSKTLAIPYNRIGVLFSKNEISSLTILNKLGYVNLSGVKLVNHILDRLDINYWWDAYSTKLKNICDTNNLRPTDCLLFAYQGVNRISLAEYWRTTK
jgi:hypothetical protein